MQHISRQLLYAILTAFVLWAVMFSPLTSPFVPFWWAMTGSAVVLISLAFCLGERPHVTCQYLQKEVWLDLLLGVGIAVVLWGCFWVGDKVSQWLFPSFARHQVDTIYQMKEGWSKWLLSGLLLLVIGPAEELFWRRYVQQELGNTWKAALLTVVIYSAVHIASLNFMLVMAAMVCGIVWGGLYLLMPKRFGAIMISHALWDAAVFIWFPIL